MTVQWSVIPVVPKTAKNKQLQQIRANMKVQTGTNDNEPNLRATSISQQNIETKPSLPN